MAVKNSKLQDYNKLTKGFERKFRFYASGISYKQDFYSAFKTQASPLTLSKIRSGNINKGSVYPGIPVDTDVELLSQNSNYSVSDSNYTNIRIIQKEINKNPVIVAYDESGYEILSGKTVWLTNSLDYFYNSLQEYNLLGSPLYPAPKDMEIVKKSSSEPEEILDQILLIFIGSGCIEILTEKTTNEYGKEKSGTVYHRFLSEGWASKYGNEINKQFYTDTVLGDNEGDYLQGDENRNSALAAIAPVVLENSGIDAGNINNNILANLKFYYYTKPLSSANSYAFKTIYSFDGAAGSSYFGNQTQEMFIKNIASAVNDGSNENTYLYNVFFEFPQNIEDWDYIYLKFDFSNLLNLKDSTRAITSYINNDFTGENFSLTTALTMLNSKIIFDSIGLLDLRYYDPKLQQWMSTNIVSKTYYADTYSSTTETTDPLGTVRDCIYESDGYSTVTEFNAGASLNYNPFFDYSECELIVYSNELGELDYKNVIVKIKIKDGFKHLVTHENIVCDTNCKLNYALVVVDNPFEIEAKSVYIPEVYGKRLFWLAVPPIVQHVGDSTGIASVAQFRIVDDVFGPEDITLNFGAALVGKFPKEIFSILKAIWIE
jgi:hypothetical protein